jgi:DNA repair protein RecN (Recombination protein N)
MLDELSVKNLGIIESARIEPGPGLVAVTGETGTGKTLLLGALRLLRGDAARTDRVGPHGDEAIVEGRFVFDDEEEVAVSRRVGSNRSRAYLDGSMVPAKSLTERLEPLIEIVAQHEHVGLGKETSLRALVDGRLGPDGLAARDEYDAAYQELVMLRREAEELGGDRRLLARELDLLKHQAAEIESAAPTSEEDEELTSRLRRLRNAGEISEAIGTALGFLDADEAGMDLLRRALDGLRNGAKLDPDLGSLVGELEGSIAGIEEVAGSIRAALDALEHEPGALAAAEARAAVIADLKRKYGDTVNDVLEFGQRAADRADHLEHSLARAETISAETAAVRERAIEAGALLIVERQKAADALTRAALDLLRTLGFGDPVLRFRIDESEPTRTGTDRMTLEFASDAALAPGPVSRVASGGELSRLVLAVRVAAGVADSPVVAFDEVDAGVGGATALAMGRQLASLSVGGQVLIVTHLPQVAAFADRHFLVERDGPSATVRRVDGSDRLSELARMLGGLEESEGGRLHAEELLALADEHRNR